MLPLPYAKKGKKLGTDFCDVRAGCVELQETHNRTTKPVGYLSHSLTNAEHLYNTTKRKHFGIFWSALLLQTYVEDTRSTIRTDQDTPQWMILNMSDASIRLAWWRVLIYKLYFNVVQRTGVKLQAADSRSRLRSDGGETTDLVDGWLVCNVDNTQVTDDEILYLHVCTECNAVADLITGRPKEKHTEKGDLSDSTVQPTKRRSREREATNYTRVHSGTDKNAYCCEAQHIE